MSILPQNDLPYKRCPRCKQIYPATPEFFARHSSNKDGLQTECKTCKNKRYHDKKDEINAKRKIYRDTHKEQISEQHKRYADTHKEHLQAYHAKYYEEHKEEWREWGKEYYQEHREQKIEYQRQYNRTHKEQISKRSKEYRVANRQRISEQRKHHHKEHREQELARRRQYYATHRSRILSLYNSGYRRTERCRVARRASWHRREARKKMIPGNYTQQQVQDQLKRQKYKCYYAACGHAKFGKVNGQYVYHVEHIVPVSRTDEQPRNDIDNIVLACPSCNLKKGTKRPHEWVDGGRLL